MSNNPNPHPAHQELLNLIPGELHPLVIPVLKKWDQGVNDQFANIRGEYKELEAFKPLIEAGIDPNFALQSAGLVTQLQNDPKDILEQINEQWKLGYVPADQVQHNQQNNLGNEELEDFEMDDVLKDPRIKALADTVEALQARLNQRDEADQNQQALTEFEKELEALESKTKGENLPWDTTYVTALMSAGHDGETAVKMFHQVLAQQGLKLETTEQQTETEQETTQPPTILGGNPSGSGLPDGQVKFGTLSKNDLNNTVEQLLQQQLQSNQG